MKIQVFKPIKLPLLLLITIVFCSITSCFVVNPTDNANNNDFSAEESFSYNVPVNNQNRLVLEAINSPVQITGEAGLTTVKIWGERIVKSDSQEDADKHLTYLDVVVNNRDDEVHITTEQPSESNGRNYQVNYNIVLPIDWEIVVGNINGKIVVETLRGDVKIHLVNGDIQISELYGNLAVAITNGNLDAQMTLLPNGTCIANSVNGQIGLRIPNNTSAELSAGVTNGSVSVNNLELQNLTSTRTSIKGKLGDGQGTIVLGTVNGIISVTGF